MTLPSLEEICTLVALPAPVRATLVSVPGLGWLVGGDLDVCEVVGAMDIDHARGRVQHLADTPWAWCPADCAAILTVAKQYGATGASLRQGPREEWRACAARFVTQGDAFATGRAAALNLLLVASTST